jgi:hypothetical protein
MIDDPRLLFGLLSLVSWFTLSLIPPAAAQSGERGVFENHTDVGNANTPGTTRYDADTQSYVLQSPTAADPSARRPMHVAWTPVTGDVLLRARLDADRAASSPTVGWTVRSSLDPGAPSVELAVHGDGQTVMRYRLPSGGTREVASSVTAPDVLQLARTGDTFEMAVAAFGDPFTRSETYGVPLGDTVYVGLFAGPSPDDEPESTRFQNVRIVRPAPDDLTPYEDHLGSNLETLNVETGHRTLLHRSPESLQAPNWTPDDAALIYNSNGLLYRFDLDTQTPEEIDTGFADANNNDHVLSFDGTQLGISHHAEAHDGASIIYTVPVEGGTPTQVTPHGPSYLHGWSPDGRFLTYTGERNGQFDIYTIPVDGGDETRLTDAPGLDDGSEYTPDGVYIYFNSVRTGSMEIWRMRPDGSGKEPLTDDRFNNWFPHISPDGTSVVFLSYRPSVPPGDHPFYKQVYLRRMPIDGGAPTVIAYLYGGQGTINVPSWSPDSERVAFISNTEMMQ